jgi:hypothetical protein
VCTLTRDKLEARCDNGTPGIPTSIFESLLTWRIPIRKGNKHSHVVECYNYSPEAKGPIFRVKEEEDCKFGAS